MTGARTWPEESRVCLLCGWWRLQREGKQQEHSGPSAAASQISWGRVCMLFSAEPSTHCADVCNRVKWIFKSRML